MEDQGEIAVPSGDVEVSIYSLGEAFVGKVDALAVVLLCAYLGAFRGVAQEEALCGNVV